MFKIPGFLGKLLELVQRRDLKNALEAARDAQELDARAHVAKVGDLLDVEVPDIVRSKLRVKTHGGDKWSPKTVIWQKDEEGRQPKP